ncbi:hypothetical protein LOAG_16155, partial [Loa loa]
MSRRLGFNLMCPDGWDSILCVQTAGIQSYVSRRLGFVLMSDIMRIQRILMFNYKMVAFLAVSLT